MKILKNYSLFLFISIFFMALNLEAKTLYINIIDVDNINSFNTFFKDLKVKRGDKFILLDSQTSQFIFEKKIINSNELLLYNKPRQLREVLYKHYNQFNDIKIKQFTEQKEVSALTKEINDLSRTLKTIKDFITLYRNQYKNIKVIFFGDSYLHNAYGNDFSKGIPSDGFIYHKNSEFNTFEDIKASFVEFAIFYDVKPFALRKKMFRFYDKLFQKKFSSKLKSFNINSVFNADVHTKYNTQPFFTQRIEVIAEANNDSCKELDKITKNALPNSAEVEISIVNECRKNTIVSFSHNGKRTQELVDKDGRVMKRFKKVVGKNIIKYINLNGKWQTIIDEKALLRQDGIEIDLQSATSRVVFRGKNPLRKDGDTFEIVYENTGARFYPKIKNGAFEEIIPIKFGKNIFSWKDMEGKKHSRTIDFTPKCMDKVTYDEKMATSYGILQVTLENKCREENSLVSFIYNNEEYIALIQKGKANANIILKYDVNDIFYENFDRKTQKLATVIIDNFSDLIRFMINYKDNVVLSMNIYEPNIMLDINKPIQSVNYEDKSIFVDGHIHIANTKSKRGDMFISEIPSIKNYLSKKFIRNYKQVYVTRRNKQTAGDLYFYVDYFSRHGLYNKEKPLCGARSLGGVVVEYDILSNGSSQTGKKFLNPSHCNGGFSTKEDSELILIKKVKIK